MNIVLLGPPGSGKGTHAASLTMAFNLAHVSSGNQFRRHFVRNTALGILSRKYMEAGELVPDEVVDAMIEEWLRQDRPESGILFDGFPRTLYQARFLQDILQQTQDTIDAVIYLDVPDEETIDRLSNRMVCHTCQVPCHRINKPPRREGICDQCGGALYQRENDTLELIRARRAAFNRVTGQLLNFFLNQGNLIIVDGLGSESEVHERIETALQGVQQQQPPLATPDEVQALINAMPEPAAPAGPAAEPGFDLVLLGAPGSGKGTQAEHLCRTLELPHIATGDLFRENLKNDTGLGRMAKAYMDRGDLVPDEVTDAMVKDRLSRDDTKKGFVLDGYPRNLGQTEALAAIEKSLGRSVSLALYIKVSDDDIVKRLSGRMICRDCQTPYHCEFKPSKEQGRCDRCGGELYQRDDDNPATVRSRLNLFHAKTEPVINFFHEAGALVEIDGEGALADVTQRTLQAAKKQYQDVMGVAAP